MPLQNLEEKSIPCVLLVTSISQKGFYIAPPSGLYRLKSSLEAKGVRCDVLDLDMEEESRYLQSISSGCYDVVGFSVSHYNMEEDLSLIWRFQRAGMESPKKIWWIGGGQEATLNYEQWLKAGLQIIFTGFAEDSLAMFCSSLSGFVQEENLSKILSDIPGVIYENEHGDVKIQPQMPLTQEIFEEYSYHRVKKIDIPFCAYWDKLRGAIAGLQFNSSRFVLENVRLYTTSHCPRGCGFCSSQSFLKESQNSTAHLVFLSAEQVYDIVTYYVETIGAKGFLFSDDDFLVGSEFGIRRVENLCSMLIEGKRSGAIPNNLIFNCQARIADFLDPQKNVRVKFIELLRQAGFHSFGLGVETFSSRLLLCESVNKKGITEDDCHRVLNALLEANLDPQINIILGIPESSTEELIRTMEVAMTYILRGCQVAVTPRMYSIPGAPIASSEKFVTEKLCVQNPFTNEEIEITRHIVPEDERIAKMLDRLPSALSEKTAVILSGTPWENSVVPKSILGIITFIVAAELLSDKVKSQGFMRGLKFLMANNTDDSPLL